PAVQLLGDDLGHDAHEPDVARVQRRLGIVAETAERAVEAAVPEAYGYTDVRADLGVVRDREVRGARVVHRVPDHARKPTLEHPLAVRLDERHLGAEPDAERLRVAVCRLD